MAYDAVKRTYSVTTDDGRFILDCRKIGDVVGNTGNRQVAEIEEETEVLVLLKNKPSIDAPDCYILGAYESFGGGTKYGSDSEKEPQVLGAMGFIGVHGRRLLLYPDGTIELESSKWCNILLDPKTNTISSFFQNSKQIKDRTNFINWIIHPDSEDMKNALMHIGISGVDSISKEIPDIEILAGALMDLDPEKYMLTEEIDPGAKLAMRITNPDGDKETKFYQQIGDLKDGSVVHTKISREDGVDAEIKIGDMDENISARFKINNVDVKVFNDGKYSITNDKTEIESTNEGTVNIVCKKSNLGTKDAKNHIAIAEQVVELMGELIDAINTSTYYTIAPGSPTKPGPIELQEFLAIKLKLKNIISESHFMDK